MRLRSGGSFECRASSRACSTAIRAAALTGQSQAIEQQRQEAEADAKRAANSTHTRRASLRYLKELQVRAHGSQRPRRLRPIRSCESAG